MAAKTAPASVLLRFFAKIAWPPTPSGCWEWAAGRGNGYGRFAVANGIVVNAHRFIYEAVYGPVPERLVIDHLCRNQGCVNPAHLQAVTIGTNTLRGENPPARNVAATHCVNGHAFTEANTYLWHGGRHCKTCRREAAIRSREAERAQQPERPRFAGRFGMDPQGFRQQCAWCQQIFHARPRRVYCSETCYLAAQRQIRAERRASRSAEAS